MVGTETLDDAAAFQWSDTSDLLMLQTVDFIPPVVDDPFSYGRIAAANALSDVYAMGGRPRTALNIAAFSADALDVPTMRSILMGALDACDEAGVALVGGHTVNDPNVKFGLSVTGEVHREKLVTNAKAEPGDQLVLTKALGTGICFDAFRASRLSCDAIQSWQASMMQLNKHAAEAMNTHRVHAATDVTGFGLAGHLQQMLRASNCSATVHASALPLLPGAAEHNRAWSAGGRRNAAYVDASLVCDDERIERLLTDPQTSGGLLIAVERNHTQALLDELNKVGCVAAHIGEVVASAAQNACRIQVRE